MAAGRYTRREGKAAGASRMLRGESVQYDGRSMG